MSRILVPDLLVDGVVPFIQSIPSVPWLEKEFGCHALHLPMGQASVSPYHPPQPRRH